MSERLHCDFETASEADLPVVGLDNYLAHPSTRVLLLAWALDAKPVQLWEPHRGPMPAALHAALTDPFVIKCAWNAAFERSVFRRRLHLWIPYAEWLDVMVWARHLSLPGSLEDAGQVLGLGGDSKWRWGTKKDAGEAQQLIQTFCLPATAAGASPLFGQTTAVFRDHRTDPELWARFGSYCVQDVEAERALLKKFLRFPLPPLEQRGWVLDQQINERGMPVDRELVQGAARVAEAEKNRLRVELTRLTQLENANSNAQMLEWLKGQGYRFASLAKAFVERALAGECELTAAATEALTLRKQASKTSDSKLQAIAHIASLDGRLRHQFSFMGAARTGRWAGKDVQLQNLPRPVKIVEQRLDEAIRLLCAGDHAAVAAAFPNPLDVVTSCLRSAFRAPAGQHFVVCDLNAIENRVLGWLARCPGILEVFEQGRCPYLAFAVHLFNVPYEDLVRIENGVHKAKDAAAAEKRQLAKPGILGCGYQLGGGDERETEDGDIVKTGLWGYSALLGVEMTQAQAIEAVRVFRSTYPEVPQLWREIEDAAMTAVRHPGQRCEVGPVAFECSGKKVLRAFLPSGRALHYLQPRIELRVIERGQGESSYEKDSITYEGLNQKTRQWERVPTYSGRLVENFCQAIARDILLHGMLLADERGFPIVGHCHDEQITLVDKNSPLGLNELRDCMTAVPSWAPGLPLGADGYCGDVYRKG